MQSIEEQRSAVKMLIARMNQAVVRARKLLARRVYASGDGPRLPVPRRLPRRRW